jgi:hypothetical protein
MRRSAALKATGAILMAVGFLLLLLVARNIFWGLILAACASVGGSLFAAGLVLAALERAEASA